MTRKQNFISCDSCRSRIDSVFCRLSEDELSNLSIQKHCNHYSKGETIFSEGNFPAGLFCMNNGKVKIYQSGFDGKEQIIRLAKDGDILGYRALISGEAYSASAAAIEDSRICFIPKDTFYELLQNSSNLTTNVMKLLAGELKEAEKKITDLAQKSVLERLAETIIMLKEYYGEENEDGTLNITITREEISDIVGTAPETVIRFLSELRKEGIILTEGRKIKILKAEALLKIANLYD